MALNIVALCVFVFGAYAYGYLVLLWLRARPLTQRAGARDRWQLRADRVSLALFVVCTVWFLVHAAIEFRTLMGDPREDDLIDLAALELTYLFPGLVLHMFLSDVDAKERRAAGHPWRWLVWTLYVTGIAAAMYVTGVIFGVVSGPRQLGPYIGVSIGSLFTITSISCLVLTRSLPKPTATRDEVRLRGALRLLFVAMIGLFVALNVLRDNAVILALLDIGARTTPLFFLLVSVYFENRIEFYDLVIKRGVLLVGSLLITGAVLTLTLGLIDAIPPGAARPWLFAVLLLPLAIILPWLHDRVGRLLDRLWFGRDYTPVEAVKHVLAGMHQATDESGLIASTESTLTDIFRRRVVILLEGQPLPDAATVVADIRTPGADVPVRLALVNDPAGRMMLSEDLALIRSLGGVFGYMLENVRLQRKRQEQEQVAHELRLQTSRSELKALRAQINPHFLFNALNAIASLIHTDPARADAAVEQLAEVFRYTLRRSDQEWAPLDQELAFARAYLDVEQARFGKRLDYTIHADERVARAHVPSMLLHTLVENAVKHGISRLRAPGRIDVTASWHDGRVVLEVRDTGPGPESLPSSHTGERFGLRSVRDRLRGHFGVNASVELHRQDHTTVARIDIPLIEDLSPTTGVVH